MATRRRTATENVARMASNRLAQTTKNNYNNKINIFKRWVRSHDDPTVACMCNDEGELSLPLRKDTILEFFGYVGNGGDRIEEDTPVAGSSSSRPAPANAPVAGSSSSPSSPPVAQEEEPRSHEPFKAVSTIGGYRSALVALYKSHRISDQFPKDEVSEFCSGYKRTIAKEKEDGRLPQREGKRACSMDTYKQLLRCSIEHGYETAAYMTNTLFLLLCWNLMSRSISVGRLCYDHITWVGDALVVELPRHKGDQEGEYCYPKHVYANPLDPMRCSILHLGNYRVCVRVTVM